LHMRPFDHLIRLPNCAGERHFHEADIPPHVGFVNVSHIRLGPESCLRVED
jgi:hypothetical protein